MGKGRKYGHDRLLHPASHTAAVDHLADLDEADVWSTAVAAAPEPTRHAPRPEPDSGGRSCRGARRWAGGLSLAFEAAGPDVPAGRRHVASSAPVSVPEWPVGRPEQANCAAEPDRDWGRDDGEWVPPHEYLARSGRGAVATSVFEGAGRTLKGRDMSRVRDAVWSQTGFFG